MALLPPHGDDACGQDNVHQAAKAARALHPTIGLVLVEHDTGKATVIPPGPSPLHEAGSRLSELVQGVAVDVAQALQRRVDSASRAIIAGPRLLLPCGRVPLNLGDGEPLDEDVGAAWLHGRTGEVYLTEALRDLLLQGRPKEESLLTLVGAQLILHGAAVHVLLGEKAFQWDWGRARFGLPSKGLVIGDNARDLRPRPHQVKEIQGHAEPHIINIKEVQVTVHLLNQGGVKRLRRVMGGQGCSP